jgi:hypothetical protein
MNIAEKITRAKADYDAVYEAGRKDYADEYWNTFWDAFQNYGNRNYYWVAFAFWPKEAFKPKYDIRPTYGSSAQMFTSSTIDNLKQILIDCGVVLDMSKAASITEAFAYAPKLTHLPTIDTTNVSSFDYLFCNDKALIEIEKLILKSDGSQKIGASNFAPCYNLVTLIVEGTIGSNGFDVHYSTKLSKASIISIINALSTTTSGLTVTLNDAAVKKAFETSSGANNGNTSTEWQSLIATRSNWNISLAPST